MEALAKSAEMPYADIAHSQWSTTTSCCVSGMKTYKHASFASLKTKHSFGRRDLSYTERLIITVTNVYSERNAQRREQSTGFKRHRS